MQKTAEEIEKCKRLVAAVIMRAIDDLHDSDFADKEKKLLRNKGVPEDRIVSANTISAFQFIFDADSPFEKLADFVGMDHERVRLAITSRGYQESRGFHALTEAQFARMKWNAGILGYLDNRGVGQHDQKTSIRHNREAQRMGAGL